MHVIPASASASTAAALSQFAMRHIFATADQGVGAGQGGQHRAAHREVAVQRIGKRIPARQRALQGLRSFGMACRSITGNGALHQRTLAATKAGAFTGGVHTG